MKVKKNKGFSLFAAPNFLSGLSRVFDISSTINVYNDSQSPEEADFRALQSDWIVVGDDIREAVSQYKQNCKYKTC